MRIRMLLVLSALLAAHAWAEEGEDPLGKAIETFHDEEAKIEDRLAALKRIEKTVLEGEGEVRLKALRIILRALPESPPKITVAILKFVRESYPQRRLFPVVVHFLAAHLPAEVRIEGIKTLARIGDVAALFAFYANLSDKDEKVLKQLDLSIDKLCWPADTDQKKSIPERWRAWFRTGAARAKLEAGWKSLRHFYEARKRERLNPIVGHVLVLLSDEKLPIETFRAGYDFLMFWSGKDFRKEDERDGPVTKEQRAGIVKAVREWHDK